jgi:cytochrome c biogenesis protein CcmG/thiol:disulfide interchange protein DsbE
VASKKTRLIVLAVGLAVVLPLLGVLYLNLGRDPHLIRSPLIGQKAPPFSLRPVGGGPPMTLESLRGRPVVVNFWATWCMPCLQEHPDLQAAARRFGDQAVFLGVVYEDQESAVAQFLARYPSAYPALMDPETRTAIAYGVQGVPETYFIDPQGVIVAKYAAPLGFETITTLVEQAGGR